MSFSNAEMDSAAQQISLGIDPETIRTNMLDRGLTDHDVYLCYKAAKLLLDSGFYDSPEQEELTPTKRENPSSGKQKIK